MQRTIVMACMNLLLALSLASAPASADEQRFGEPLSVAQSVRISDVLNEPDAYVDKRIRVEGLVDDVCPRKGCWVDILDAQSSETIRFKVKDDVVVFPVEARGQEIVAEGILRKRQLSREDAVSRLRHLAEEKGEEFDEASVTGALVFYQIEGAGAVVGWDKNE